MKRNSMMILLSLDKKLKNYKEDLPQSLLKDLMIMIQLWENLNY